MDKAQRRSSWERESASYPVPGGEHSKKRPSLGYPEILPGGVSDRSVGSGAY